MTVAKKLQRLLAAYAALLVAASLALGASGCIRQTSEDADILKDAGTSSGAAIVIDPD